MNLWSFIRSGAIAGAASAFVLAAVHHLLISNIWFSLVMMLAAGALCGACVGWSYALLAHSPSAGGWLRYNMLYLAMFALLGALSVLVYEPVTTVAAVLAADDPFGALIWQALPLTVVFTLAMAALISLLYGRSWRQYAAVLLTCSVLVLLLGLNITPLGLVEVPTSSLYLVAELFGLILAINLTYAALFLALERKRLFRGAAARRAPQESAG